MKLSKFSKLSKTFPPPILTITPNSVKSLSKREFLKDFSLRIKKVSSIPTLVLLSAKTQSLKNIGISTWLLKKLPKDPALPLSIQSCTILLTWLKMILSKWPSANVPITTIGKEQLRSPLVLSMLIYWLTSSPPPLIPNNPSQKN